MKNALALLLSAVLLLGGCSQTVVQDYAPPQKNRLVIYTSHKPEVYGSIVKEFEERTGVWVQVETGGSSELLERIVSEAEDTRCDLIFGGGVETLEAYKSYFSPYESEYAQEVHPSYRSDDGLWTPFSLLPMVIIYNPKLVTGTRPVGWISLLEPYWKGKISFANPEVSGSGYTALATMLQALPLEQEELLRRFTQNLDGRVIESSGEVVGAVADGSCYIGVTLEETALKGIAAGYDIAMIYPQEGTSAVPDGAAIVSGCVNAENARQFLDFILSPEVQKRLGTQLSRRSVRTDMFVPEGQTHGLVLLEYDWGLASEHRREVLDSWKSLIEGAGR